MHNIGLFTFILTTILCILVLLLGYYLHQQSKLSQKILEKISANPSSQTADNFIVDLVDYGLKNGDLIPTITVTDPMLRETISLNINDNENEKETLLLITGAGCGPCEETLHSLTNFNLQQLSQNLVVLTFIPPTGIEDAVIKKHLSLANSVTNSNYIIQEDILVALDIRTFPTLIRVAFNGKVLGTYRGHKDQVKHFLKFQSERYVS